MDGMKELKGPENGLAWANLPHGHAAAMTTARKC